MNLFRFGNPEFLYLLIIGLPIVILLVLFGLYQKRKSILLFQSKINIFERNRYLIKSTLLILAFISISLASALPQWGSKPETVGERLDIMLALDTSTSMLATDNNSVRRLTYAKETIFSILDELDGDRVGLLYFAEASVVVCPITSDLITLREFLNALTPTSIIHRGTRIANAIEIARDRFIKQNSELEGTDLSISGQKALILITDGEDHGEDVTEVVETAKMEGIHIYCVGIGNSTKSVPIPLADENGGYKRDVDGQLVLTTLDEKRLSEIAEMGNGKYYHANDGISELMADLAKLEKKKYRIISDGELKNRFKWFAGLAFLLLACELLIKNWKIDPQKLGISKRR